MTSKILGTSLTALAALAIAATFVSSSSFAAEFTVHHGKRYRATLALSSIEVDIAVHDGVITGYGHSLSACALGQTSAAIVASVATEPSANAFHITSWFFLSRNGGDMTFFAPSKFGSAAVRSSSKY